MTKRPHDSRITIASGTPKRLTRPRPAADEERTKSRSSSGPGRRAGRRRPATKPTASASVARSRSPSSAGAVQRRLATPWEIEQARLIGWKQPETPFVPIKGSVASADSAYMSAKPPGDYSRQQLHRLMVLVCILMGTTAVLAIMGFWWWPASLLALPTLWVLGRETDRGGLLDPLPHRKGEQGEESVGAVLAELPEGYRVHHGLEPGRGNVDHVVIGPTGVFAIETKNVTGPFEVRHGRLTRDGFDASEVLRQARAEAMAIRDRLRAAEIDLWVEAIVASAGGKVKDGPLVIENVTVLSASCLRAFISNRRVRMSAGEVSRAETAILRSESAGEHVMRRTEGVGFSRRTP